jgi:hypothetical protein
MCKCLCCPFTGAIALADAADTESARTTIAKFRIIADLFARARPNSLSHLITPRLVEPKIIEVAQRGISDPVMLRVLTPKEFRSERGN